MHRWCLQVSTRPQLLLLLLLLLMLRLLLLLLLPKKLTKQLHHCLSSRGTMPGFRNGPQSLGQHLRGTLPRHCMMPSPCMPSPGRHPETASSNNINSLGSYRCPTPSEYLQKPYRGRPCHRLSSSLQFKTRLRPRPRSGLQEGQFPAACHQKPCMCCSWALQSIRHPGCTATDTAGQHYAAEILRGSCWLHLCHVERPSQGPQQLQHHCWKTLFQRGHQHLLVANRTHPSV